MRIWWSDREQDVGSGVGLADADVVEPAGDAEGDVAGFGDAVGAEPVMAVARPQCPEPRHCQPDCRITLSKDFLRRGAQGVRDASTQRMTRRVEYSGEGQWAPIVLRASGRDWPVCNPAEGASPP